MVYRVKHVKPNTFWQYLIKIAWLNIVTLLLVIRLGWGVVIFLFQCFCSLVYFDLSFWFLVLPPRTFKNPQRMKVNLFLAALCCCLPRPQLVEKIDLFCDGVFAPWFLIITGSYKGRLSLWFRGAANLCFTLKECVCCSHTDNISMWGRSVWF